MKANQKKNHMAIVVNDETFTNTTHRNHEELGECVFVRIFFNSKYTCSNTRQSERARVREREQTTRRQ